MVAKFLILLIVVSITCGEDTKSGENTENSAVFQTKTSRVKFTDSAKPAEQDKAANPTGAEKMNLVESFTTNKVTPDVVLKSPEKLLEVKYEGNKEVNVGNELTPKQVLKQPAVKFDAEKNSFYTLIMTDPDAPSRNNPNSREWSHWLVVNIPENDISKGETLSSYIGSAPPKDSGLHRYVFLVFKQPEKLKFNDPKHGPTDGNRSKFNTENFSKIYNLGSPIAGNFFQAKWDDSVPATHKSLTS